MLSDLDHNSYCFLVVQLDQIHSLELVGFPEDVPRIVSLGFSLDVAQVGLDLS